MIDHVDGLVLFDTGQDRASVTDPGYFPKGVAGLLYRRLAQFAIGEDETLAARLRALGKDVGDVRLAVLSHLHQDHIGGLRELTGAEVVVSATEWASLSEPGAELNGLLRQHIDLPGLRRVEVDPASTDDPTLLPFVRAHDLMGDGSLMLLPTPGHTAGSLSLFVRGSRSRPPVLLVGDLTYDIERLDRGAVPGVGNRRELRRTTAMVDALRARHPGLVVAAAHDPTAAGRLQAALGQGLTATQRT